MKKKGEINRKNSKLIRWEVLGETRQPITKAMNNDLYRQPCLFIYNPELFQSEKLIFAPRLWVDFHLSYLPLSLFSSFVSLGFPSALSLISFTTCFQNDHPPPPLKFPEKEFCPQTVNILQKLRKINGLKGESEREREQCKEEISMGRQEERAVLDSVPEEEKVTGEGNSFRFPGKLTKVR